MRSPAPRSALSLMLPWLILALVVGVLDQFTKQLVLANLHYGQVIPVTGFFDLVLVFNTGAAFSFLAEHSGWQRWFFTVLALAVSGWLLTLMHHHRHERLLPAAFARSSISCISTTPAGVGRRSTWPTRPLPWASC